MKRAMSDEAYDPTALLNSPQRTAGWLKVAHVADPARGHQNLLNIANSGVTIDLLGSIFRQLQQTLPTLSDPDMALNNLERFMGAVRSPLSFATLCERDENTLPVLLRIFSTSQYLSDVMIHRPAVYDETRRSQGAPVSAEFLAGELMAELSAVADDTKAMGLTSGFKRLQMVRIAYGDIIGGQRLETVSRQISYLADAICQAALSRVQTSLHRRFGTPRGADGKESGFVVLALGKLGGLELNYSSDIDLIFLYDEDGNTDGEGTQCSIENREYFDRLARRFVQWLTQTTPHGSAYRVDLRLRPEGSQGPSVMSRQTALHYYDVVGRTWERQAMVKARPIAGDLQLGREFLMQLEPWIYRSYLSRTEIAGIQALKRQIEKRAKKEGNDRLEVKTGHGGIRDIEFVIQFLQLLMGSESAEIRTGNTLEAIAQLARFGGLTMQEQTLLERNYLFLRTIEHRLQILFDAQTHRIPESRSEQQKLAMRLGYDNTLQRPAQERLMADLDTATAINRRILDHLLHNTVGNEELPAAEIDLVLDPEPDAETIRDVLGKHGFRDTKTTYRLLMDLATERHPFLSKRRCRHFLATIAPTLLTAVAQTPDPQGTLVTLSRVSDSLGGKGALWELFNHSAPSLELYVRLCAACPYLVDILTSNPGMLDELVDSLLLECLPTLPFLETSLAMLCGGAKDIGPILSSFKHVQHVRVGARDILGKENIRSTTRALSDIAEICLRRIAEHETERLIAKYGQPICDDTGRPCELVILAAGKTGGREPNYHSDIDVIFLFEGAGSTQANLGVETTTNHHFFAELGQRIIKAMTRPGPFGALYSVDARLRPTGKSGALAVSLAEFEKYFASGSGQLWERLALCKARTITGSPTAQAAASAAVKRILTDRVWGPNDAQALYDMRIQWQESASLMNLKRGPGGTVDIEFSIQMLQLKYGGIHPQILRTGVWETIEALRDKALLSAEEAAFLDESYTFLRGVDARLRLMDTECRHDFPEDEMLADKLAFLLHQDDPQALREKCERYRRQNREVFLRIVESLR
jgi:glutamate-ammonia-ligase adenylyltransferase